MSLMNHSYSNESSDHPTVKIKSQADTINEEDNIKKYYIRLINEEFRRLQLDPELKSKSLFDLIDYCELLYEDLSKIISSDDGLKAFVRGYLIFNYFINSLIIMHFNGFDEFIKSNERDFIIYLHLFTFYNTDDYIKTDTRSIPLGILRKWTLNYLISKELLKFDVDVLYNWLYQYIDYLKEKDVYETEPEVSSENRKEILKSDRMFNIHAQINNLTSDQSSLQDLYVSRLDGSDNSDDNVSLGQFRNRYPSFSDSTYSRESLVFQPVKNLPDEDMGQSNESISISSSAPPMPQIPPPVPSVIPPPLPMTSAPSIPKDSISNHYQSSSTSTQKVGNTPYPIDHKKSLKITPYPISNNLSGCSNSSTDSYNQEILGSKNQSSNVLQDFNQGNSNNEFDVNGISNTYLKYNRPVPSIPRTTQTYNYNLANYGANAQYSNQINLNQFMYVNQPISNPYSHPPPPSLQVRPPQHTMQQQNYVKYEKINYMKAYSICGLKNFGSSCYINLTIQLLFGLLQFKMIFANLRFVEYIKDPKFVSLLKHLGNSKESLLLSDAICGLLKSFESHGGAAIAPTKFLRISSFIKPDFNIPNEQQDAQEFLLFVLERLHDELSCKSLDGKEIELETLEQYILKWNININLKDKEDYLTWYKSLVKTEGNSPINDLFQGHLQNKLICNKCGYESINYSPFTILSLPIPNYQNTVVNLSDCLRYYTQDEVLSGENAWNCPKCCKSKDGEYLTPPNSLDNHPVFTSKKSGIFRLGRRSKSPSRDKQKAANAAQDAKKDSISIKTLNFIKLPKVLFIHLARFSMTSMTDKVHKVIKYPLELKFNNHSNNINHEITYKLVGLINHYGNLKSGHYTALINKSAPSSSRDDVNHPFWCYFDDDSVKVNLRHGDITKPNVNFDELNSRDVYVLCYERT